MATTYEAIATVTVGSGGAASIEFTSIPQTYTDLKIVISGRNTASANNWYLLRLQFNSDTTAANYSYRLVAGFGTSVFSSSASDRYGGYIPSDARTASTFGNTELYIPNYTGSNNKSFSTDTVTEGNGSAYEILGLWAGLWSSSAAISSITLSNDSGNFAQYSTATLYGIKNS
jgi:hypothetical protein